jgi:ABC-2 type transport system permease protein
MLDSLRHYARVYFLIEAQYIKARLQYRADFIISSIGMFVTILTTLGVFWVIFDSIPLLAGWTFEQLVFIYAFYMIATAPMQIFFDNFWQLRFHVIEGTFIKYYFRPLNMMFYYTSEMFDLKGLTQLGLGVALFVYASNTLGIEWDLVRILLLLLTLFSAALVIISIMIISAVATFWIYNSYPVMDLAWRIREFSPYPMTIFDGVYRFLFTYIIPIGFVAYYPSQLFLRPEEATSLVYFSPLVGIALFILAYNFWNHGVNSYTGTGS